MRRFVLLLALAACAAAGKGKVPLDAVLTLQDIDYYCSFKQHVRDCGRIHRSKISALAKKVDAARRAKTNELFFTDFMEAVARVYVGEMLIDDVNFVIHDEAVRNPLGRLRIHRRMRIVGSNFNEDMIVASATLNVPLVYPNPLDTTLLSVDHTRVDPLYLRVMLAAPFATGSLSIDPNGVGSILQVGLGAGLMNNFMHRKFPNVNITIVDFEPLFSVLAKKFFQLQLDTHQQIVHMEAIEYFASIQHLAPQYDVMFFDATCNTYEPDGTCGPFNSFVEERCVKLYRKSLRKSGVLVMSVMYDEKRIDGRKLVASLISKLKHGFDECVALWYDTMLIGQVIVCGPVANADTLKLQVREYSKLLGFDLGVDWVNE